MPPRAFRHVVALALALGSALAACGVRYAAPRRRARDARFGYLGGGGRPPARDALCRDWRAATARDPRAQSHVSFPETAPRASCFARVVHANGRATAEPPSPACAYPDAAQRARLVELAARLERGRARGADRAADSLVPCGLSPAQRDAAMAHNARVLRATAARLGRPGAPTYPYAAVIVPGFGWRDQALASIASWRPGDRCRVPARGDVERLGVMVYRTRRAAEALRGGVAPVAIVSGGAVHSPMVEAFAMLYILRCLHGVRSDRVLVEPCAEHTHTNVRNGGRWVVAMGGRAAYLTTDDGLQGAYFQDWSAFDLVRAGIDHRALRDWSYLLGAWRQASEGTRAGFWYSPYRFWAEPRDGLGGATCLDDATRGD